ncbi:MAG: DUF58 domain-containing protein [Planctomycetaceae bacterium]
MIIRPGRNLLILIAIETLIGVVAFVWEPILWIVGLSLLIVIGLTIHDARRAARLIDQIKASRRLPRVVGRGVPFEILLNVTNETSTHIAGEIRDVRPAACQPIWNSVAFDLVSSGTCIELKSDCKIPVRGLHRFGSLWVRIQGPFGLIEVQREITTQDEIKILPETFASRGELQKDLKAELQVLDKVNRTRQKGSGSEFVTLEEFRQGDDPRRIDWRATAHHRFPIVRRYQVERHRDVLILIDNGRLMGTMTDRGSKLDCAVDASLNLARVVLESGDRCGIGFFDSSLRGHLRPMAGPNSLRNLVECVYDLQTQWKETDFTRVFAEIQQRQSKRCLLVILSDLGDAETSRMHCAALEKLNRRHLVLFAALRTPLLERVIQGSMETVVEGASKAVAMGLLRDRGRSLHALKHGGLQILDVEPQQLTLPLINQFIELRTRNLL